MRSRARLLSVFALAVSAIAGCNEVYTPPETAPLSLVALAYVSPSCEQGCEKKALEGVEICEVGTTNCEVTDARGAATLVLPAGEEVSWTFQKEGHQSSLVADVTDETSFRSLTYTLWSDERSAEWFEYMMSVYPQRGVGHVRVVLEPPLEGATFDLIGATGPQYYGVEPPAFFPADFDLELEATTSGGSGGFLEVVAPGRYQIEVGGTAQSCFVLFGWPGDAPNRVLFPIREGHTTNVSLRCRE